MIETLRAAKATITKSTKAKAKIVVQPRLIQAAQLDPKGALALLNADPMGLTPEEAERRQEQYGKNEIAREKPPAWYIQLAHAFITPFNGILFFVSTVSLFTDVILADPEDRSYRTIIVLMTMVLLSTLLRFWQEFRSGAAAEKLKAMVRTTTRVLRQEENEQSREIPLEELVPGDIVHLSAGDMIPADVRVLSSKDLFISQAMLTGESIPLEKMAAAIASDMPNDSPLDMRNLCFMGTNVVSGSGLALAMATGNDTYFGQIAHELTGQRPLTSFDKGINRMSWVLVRFMFIMVPVVFVLNVVTKHNWLEALLFAVTIAVGLTPEMLPMIVSANLARGAVVMSRRKTVVKRLNSIQNFGAMDILCTDKTGTLTQDKVLLEKHLDMHGKEDIQTLEYAWLNSNYQTGLKNLLDVAVLDYGKQYEIDHKLRSAYRKVDEIPFDFVRRRMSVVVRGEDGQNVLICKGAVEEILGLCTQADENGYLPGGVVPFTDKMGDDVRTLTRDLNEDGLRVLAIAHKFLPAENRTYTVEDEKDLILAGYIAFLDPPKETARTALEALAKHGVEVKIITGDNEIVTRKICREVGLEVRGALQGKDIDALSDGELALQAQETTVFSKMSPLQKSRVIRALQSKGHTVGYMGDGINDAAALRDADVGISVDTAVDIAKESADIILLEKSLMVLEEGVIEGRRTFANIIKYIKMTASSNFGNVFSVLVASAFLPFLPMLPIHLLIQNLLYDVSQISIPWDRVDEAYLAKPRKWEAGGLARFMLFIGPLSSVFDIATFAIMWYVFGANSPEHQALFQSGWFIEGLCSQTLIVHMIRTEKIPFIQSSAAPAVIALTAAVMAIGIAIPFSFLAPHVKLEPLPWQYFPMLFGLLLGYCMLTQIVKRWYIRRFHEWL